MIQQIYSIPAWSVLHEIKLTCTTKIQLLTQLCIYVSGGNSNDHPTAIYNEYNFVTWKPYDSNTDYITDAICQLE